eukprot:scaffold205150_cov63-Attheya_sp.AAC.1
MSKTPIDFNIDGFFGALGTTTAADRDSVKLYLASSFLDTARLQPSPRAAKPHVESVGVKNTCCALPSLEKGGTCAIATHLKQMELSTGCYLWARRRTIYAEPFTPPGVPFDKPGVLEALLDDADPFMLSVGGQWKYVFEAILGYQRGRVEQSMEEMEVPSVPSGSPSSLAGDEGEGKESTRGPILPDPAKAEPLKIEAPAQSPTASVAPPWVEEAPLNSLTDDLRQFKGEH